MIDINFIRGNAEAVKKAVIDKRMNADIDKLLELDAQMRGILPEIDALRAERNSLSKPTLLTNRDYIVARVKEIKEVLSVKEPVYAELRKAFNDIMLTVPSIPAPEVPIGKDENDNVEIRRVGSIPKFDFEMKDHMALAESLDLVDVPQERLK